LELTAETQPQLHPRLLRLSALISQYLTFLRRDSCFGFNGKRRAHNCVQWSGPEADRATCAHRSRGWTLWLGRWRIVSKAISYMGWSLF